METKIARTHSTFTTRLMFWLLAVGGAGVIFLVTVAPQAAESRKLRDRAAHLNHQVALRKRSVEELEQEKQAALHDPFYAEVVARTELWLVKPGEEVLCSRRPRHAVSATPQSGAGPGMMTRLLATVTSSPGYCFVGFLLGLLAMVAALCLFGQEHQPERKKVTVRSSSRRSWRRRLR